MKKIGLILLWSGAVIVLLIALALWILPPRVEKALNRCRSRTPGRVTAQALALHQKLLIVDMHSDSLLWDRNLLKRNAYGHVDIPRLVEGHVALQAFTIVTQSPKNQNYQSNEDASDNITWLAVIQRWPMPCWWSYRQRALQQARRLHRYAERSKGKFSLIRSAADLKKYLTRRKNDPSLCAGFLGIEGAHALEGDLKNIDLFYAVGIRMMSPAHFIDNDMAGSAHGLAKGGLTDMGKKMIRQMEAKHMLVDLAHVSAETITDTLAIATKPVVVSHTGVDGACPGPRNLTDAQVKAIAKTGGVICIGYWDGAVCGNDAKAIARSLKYAVNLAGIAHVGLGSDYDGSITVPFATDRLVELTTALLDQGFSQSEIERLMGGNLIRLLERTLP